ncbi:MAG: hypothetical protein UHN88_08955 [Eubacterium sp.]|nr:hypothetical protein [Eubacterium sp.]
MYKDIHDESLFAEYDRLSGFRQRGVALMLDQVYSTPEELLLAMAACEDGTCYMENIISSDGEVLDGINFSQIQKKES